MGRNDREAFALLHADRTRAEALRSVVETVTTHRRPGALAHPSTGWGVRAGCGPAWWPNPPWSGAAELVAVPGVPAPRAA